MGEIAERGGWTEAWDASVADKELRNSVFVKTDSEWEGGFGKDEKWSW